MRFAVLLLASILATPVLSAQRAVPSGGQWLIDPGERSGTVQLSVRYGERGYSSNWSRVPLGELVGLSAADMRGSGATVHFKIVRSAGTLDCEGWFDGGKGSGFKDLSAEELVRVRDHGVDPDFIASLGSAGYKNLGIEALVRLRDHGVDGDYIADMKEMGYAPSDPEDLVESRDHGVDPSYIRSLKEAGYERLSLPELRRARDHGVTRGFIERVKAHGYGKPSLDEVIRLRDRGLD